MTLVIYDRVLKGLREKLNDGLPFKVLINDAGGSEYALLEVNSINQIQHTTDGAIYDVALSLFYYNPKALKLRQLFAVADKIRKVIALNPQYRTSSINYYFDLAVSSIIFPTDEDHKIEISLSCKYETIGE